MTRINNKHQLIHLLINYFKNLSELQFKNIFHRIVDNITSFLNIHPQSELNQQEPQVENKRSNVHQKLYDHYFQREKRLEHKLKLRQNQPQCTFSPKINKDEYISKIMNPLSDRTQFFLHRKKIQESIIKQKKQKVPQQCTFKPKINSNYNLTQTPLLNAFQRLYSNAQAQGIRRQLFQRNSEQRQFEKSKSNSKSLGKSSYKNKKPEKQKQKQNSGSNQWIAEQKLPKQKLKNTKPKFRFK